MSNHQSQFSDSGNYFHPSLNFTSYNSQNDRTFDVLPQSYSGKASSVNYITLKSTIR